jgi:surface polysaccharide O-acyltransferase-like enzyme
MNKVNQEDREFWVDYLRVIATIAVIFLHVTANPVVQYGNIPPLYWWIVNIYDSLVRFVYQYL